MMEYRVCAHPGCNKLVGFITSTGEFRPNKDYSPYNKDNDFFFCKEHDEQLRKRAAPKLENNLKRFL